MSTPDLATARDAWLAIGALPLPAATDGTKRPGVKTWRNLQNPDNRPTPEQLDQLWRTDTDGIGIICGRASGNIEMLELEGAAVAEGWMQRLHDAFTDHAQEELWQRLVGGYMEFTPTGGIHIYYRIDGDVHGNTKLASRPTTTDEQAQHPGQRTRVMIETRGEGGWSIVAPSRGRTHPTGAAWTALPDRSPQQIATFTTDERDTIHAMCRLLDEAPATASSPVVPATSPRPTIPAEDRLRPGDDFNARASWADILQPHGWTIDHTQGGTTYWIRPGKKRGQGVSATTGHSTDGADRLYVFSTSTDFQPEIPYSRLGAYAVLNHGGDHSAAASALHSQGWGDQEPEWTLTLEPAAPPASSATGPRTTGDVQDGQPETIEANETALADAFVSRVANQVRYCPQRKQWLTWDGSRWVWDEGEYHRELIKQLARRLPADDKAAAGWRRKMLSAQGVGSIARLARTDPRIVVHLDQLDAQPWELNTPAGIINLRTGELQAPDPVKLHTRSTTVAPDFAKPAPHWEAFLSATFGGDSDLIGYVKRLAGVTAIGEIVEQLLSLGIGSGANGKSTLLDALSEVLGRGERGYAIAAPAEMLMARRHSEHPAELAQLAGARLVVCSELEDGARFAEARIKQLTGRDAINARHMYGSPFTFMPTHTLWLIANHKPATSAGGPAFWRRLQTLPFQHVVPEGQRDPELPAKLRSEGPQILAWIVQGAAEWGQGGLRPPSAVRAATQEYRTSEDTLQRFVDEQCHLAPGSQLVQVRSSVLRDAYERFCRDMGDEPMSGKRYIQGLRERFGVTFAKGAKGARFSQGITLLGDEEEEGNGDDMDWQLIS